MDSIYKNPNFRFENSVDALILCGAGLLVLLIGSWVPDSRLDVSGIPLGVFLMSIMVLLLAAQRQNKRILYVVALFQVPFICLTFTVFWSGDAEYGLNKVSTLVFSSSLAVFLFLTTIHRVSLSGYAYIMILYLSLLLLAAFFYKLNAGFFDRKVPFFINGPIIFARLMAIACILSVFFLTGFKRFVAVFLFFLAVLWAQSKGPLLALLISLFGIAFFSVGIRARVFFLSVAVFCCFVIVYSLSLGLIDSDSLGRLGILVQLLAGNFDVLYEASNYGSLGSRLGMWSETVSLIQYAPLGVGLGGWSSAVVFYSDMSYPHNLLLELWSEGGVLFGTFAFLPFCMFFFFSKKNAFYFIALFLLMAQMFSGDLGDARFLLVFSIMATLGYSKAKKL